MFYFVLLLLYDFNIKKHCWTCRLCRFCLEFDLHVIIIWNNGKIRVGKTISTAYDSLQFSSVAQSCLILWDPMAYSMPGLPVHHQLPEFTQTHVHRVGDIIQPSHLLLFPSPPVFNLSQNQRLLQWVNSSHQVAKILEFQLQHQSFQWTPRTDLL